MNLRSALAMVLANGLVFVFAGPATAGTIGFPTATGLCVTSDPFHPDPGGGVLFRPIPVGCELTNSGPFTFANVRDLDDVPHTVTISELVFFQLPATEDGSTFIRGDVDGTTFTGLDMSSGGSDSATFLTAQGLDIPMAAEFPSLGIDWGNPLMRLRLADGTRGLFAQLVHDNGDGTYDVAAGGAFLLAVTLNGGASFVAEDPMFSIAPFAVESHEGLADLLPQAVPEPGTLTLLGMGLTAGWAAVRRRASRG